MPSYVYDSWGNILEEKCEPILRRLNTFRYRGYVYDEDTAMYYLQTRYYLQVDLLTQIM